MQKDHVRYVDDIIIKLYQCNYRYINYYVIGLQICAKIILLI